MKMAKFPSDHDEVNTQWCCKVHNAAWDRLVNDRKLDPVEIEMVVDALGYLLSQLPEDGE